MRKKCANIANIRARPTTMFMLVQYSNNVAGRYLTTGMYVMDAVYKLFSKKD